MSTNIKLNKLSKIIQSREILGALLGKLAGQLMKVGLPLAKTFLAPLTTMALASAIPKYQANTTPIGENLETKVYYGICETTFKLRYTNHKSCSTTKTASLILSYQASFRK